MARDLNAVIVALLTVLAEAEERSSTSSWKVHILRQLQASDIQVKT